MWIAVFVVLVAGVNCRSDIPEEDILDDLFYSYNKHARPSLGPLHTVTVSHSLTLTRIVSMEKHVLTADTWQMMKWQDSRLTWDPDDYAQVKNINIPDELVWTPDIVLYNNAAATSGKMYASIRVVVDMSGNAVWIPGTRVTAYCEEVTSSDRADISAGDFKCPLKFGSWTYHKKSLNMTIAGDGLLMSDYIKSPQYEIIDYEVNLENLNYACCPDPYTSVTYTLWLRRKCQKTVVLAGVCDDEVPGGKTDSSDSSEADDSTGTDDNGADDKTDTSDDDSQTDSSNTNEDDDNTDDNSDTSDDDTDDNTDGTDNNSDTNNDDSQTDSSNTNEDDDNTDDNSDTIDDDTDDNTDGTDDTNEANSDDDSQSEQDSDSERTNVTSQDQDVKPVVQT
ncbi:uncharacterized protein LOC110453723 isoform X2 [Mizuhopecten yessoensis]|uniref:uncharacterized protein LOC110453723 isoform X2 n=1 Tax=Mizuhopecten yessoensis TaxID=6573 RepID=UPI000B45A528|nr:uncharacterized protein LOC110453723 isoform X2 [Mizuhopecten yessoensis]